ncbi:hypothetical protein Tco_0951326 [Tanacetum coccineum]|uniref:Uncharacterized protein n=1 Tax=Tanacetum coccineum TaxID=301880 RepID=A0ABQ5DTU8_9ASTR
MRMEQYIQMVDYSLWEVIENGNAPSITKLVEGVKTVIALSTAEEKAHGRCQVIAEAVRRRFWEGVVVLKDSEESSKAAYLTRRCESEVLKKSVTRMDTHTIMWRNKPEIDTLSLDDLYNNLKIYEPEVKGTSSSSTNTQNVAFESSDNTSSTIREVNTAYGVTTASTQATAVNSTTIDNLSDDVICAFFASQQNSPHLDNEDLQQINPGDLEEMNLRAPRNQENMYRENARSVPVETTTSNALILYDGLGDYDWSDQAEEGPTNFALMAYSSTSSNFGVSTDSNCSSSCLENFKILKEQNEQLLKDLRTSKITAITYKTELESVEERLLVYKKIESVSEEDIKLLKRKIYLKEVAITELWKKLKLAQKQKDEIHLTVENFENSSKNLNKLLDCQIVDKCKTGLEYNVVPPPYTGNFLPPKHDFSLFGIKEFVNESIVSEPTIKKHVVETSEAKASADLT